MNTIQEINARIYSKGNQMAAEAKTEIVKITIHITQQTNKAANKEVSLQPLMLTGCACVALSIIGSAFSDSKWPLGLGVAGLLFFGVGYAKSKQSNSSKAGVNTISNAALDTEKAFIIEKCNAILDAKTAEWDSFMESIKSEVQNLVNNANIPETEKDECLTQTYYPESLSLSTLSLINEFNKINNTSDFATLIMSKKEEFANEVALSIKQTAKAQKQTYSRISI